MIKTLAFTELAAAIRRGRSDLVLIMMIICQVLFSLEKRGFLMLRVIELRHWP